MCHLNAQGRLSLMRALLGFGLGSTVASLAGLESGGSLSTLAFADASTQQVSSYVRKARCTLSWFPPTVLKKARTPQTL